MNERRSDHEWIESSFRVNGRQVGVSVRRLDQREAERLAASLAWFGSRVLRKDATEEPSGWPATLQYIFNHYIALTMDEREVGALDEVQICTAVCAAALTAFIQANRLDPAIAHHLAPHLGHDVKAALIH